MNVDTHARKQTTRVIVLIWSMAMGLAVPACSFSDSDSTENTSRTEIRSASDAMSWAGFNDINGLEMVTYHGEARLDELEQFVLSGTSSAVDHALEAAQFTAPPTDGADAFEPALSGFDPKTLQNPHNANDEWTNKSGQHLFRHCVRGGAPHGREVIHVWAFTT